MINKTFQIENSGNYKVNRVDKVFDNLSKIGFKNKRYFFNNTNG